MTSLPIAGSRCCWEHSRDQGGPTGSHRPCFQASPRDPCKARALGLTGRSRAVPKLVLQGVWKGEGSTGEAHWVGGSQANAPSDTVALSLPPPDVPGDQGAGEPRGSQTVRVGGSGMEWCPFLLCRRTHSAQAAGGLQASCLGEHWGQTTLFPQDSLPCTADSWWHTEPP